MSTFNAQKARTKYALPMWVDAFVRKTLDLSADEVGGYNLLLWAMWAREDLSLPDDDRKLARIARTTAQTWRRRIRPALEPHFEVSDGVWTSDRLAKEAARVEKRVRAADAMGVDCIRRPSLSMSMRAFLMERDGSRCVYCGSSTGPFEVDHVLPLSKGGESTPENLAIACRPCNRSKGSKTCDEWAGPDETR